MHEEASPHDEHETVPRPRTQVRVDAPLPPVTERARYRPLRGMEDLVDDVLGRVE